MSKDNFPEPKKLEVAIMRSMEVPFQQADTLIYESFIEVCGNSSDDERNRFYKPSVLEKGGGLGSKFSGKVLYTRDRLDTLMERACSTSRGSFYSCFFEGKVRADIFGYVLSNDSLEIIEKYILDDKYLALKKLFVFQEGNWNHQLQERFYTDQVDSLDKRSGSK